MKSLPLSKDTRFQLAEGIDGSEDVIEHNGFLTIDDPGLTVVGADDPSLITFYPWASVEWVEGRR